MLGLLVLFTGSPLVASYLASYSDIIYISYQLAIFIAVTTMIIVLHTVLATCVVFLDEIIASYCRNYACSIITESVEKKTSKSQWANIASW